MNLDRNVVELANLLDAEYFTLGTTGKEALIAMMYDIADAFAKFDSASSIFDWLENEDGTQATFADVLSAIALVAHRFEDENLMNVVPD